MKEKKQKTVLFYITIITTAFGLLGFCYGYRKDQALKKIQQRANSPFFKASALLIDSHYDSRKEPLNLDASLNEISLFEVAFIPDDYPDNYPSGLLLKNTGSELRSFEIQPKEQIVFQKSYHLDPKLYELRYIFSKSSKGEKIRFTITYETSEGFQGKQVWEIEKGITSIKRIKPKIP